MFHDTVMSLVVVVVIVGLACIWKWTIPGDHTGTGAGWLGPLYSDKADPGTTNFVPRPGLVLLLPLLPAPDLQVAGLGDPRDGRDPDDPHGAAARAAVPRPAAGAAAVPAAGRGGRSRSSSVISMGDAHLQGRDREGGARQRARGARAGVGEEAGLRRNGRRCRARSSSPRRAACTCHTYLGTGSSNLGAPDLSDDGSKGRGVQFQIRHLKCPSCVNPGSPMPPFGVARRRQPPQARDLPRGVEGRQVDRQRTMLAVRVFLGITGASGAPYAARLLEALDGGRLRGRRLRLGAPGSR